MKQRFMAIWKESLHMQDLRGGDKGHVMAVAGFAEKLCSMLGADEDVVMPAAILHDVGYFGMDKRLLKELMEKKLPKEKELNMKNEHALRGAEIAENIMKSLDYPENIIIEIKRIILGHDNSIPARSREEGIVRDADKLWRYTKEGFALDVKRRKCSNKEWHDKLFNNLKKDSYFQTEEARNMAEDMLEKLQA